MKIEKKKTEYNPDTLSRKLYKPQKSLHTPARVNEMRKINNENKVS